MLGLCDFVVFKTFVDPYEALCLSLELLTQKHI